MLQIKGIKNTMKINTIENTKCKSKRYRIKNTNIKVKFSFQFDIGIKSISYQILLRMESKAALAEEIIQFCIIPTEKRQ